MQTKNSQLESQLATQLDQKALLEAEINELSKQMVVFTDRLEKAMEALEAEYQNRQRMEADFEAQKAREMSLFHENKELRMQVDRLEKTLETEYQNRQRMEADFEAQKAREISLLNENKELRMQVDTLEKTLHTNLENEHESNTRMLQENELLNLTLVNRETQIEELKRQIAALEQNLLESNEKNEKLVSLLTQEIDRHAEDYKQKAIGTIFPANQNLKRLPERSPQSVKSAKLSDSYQSQRFVLFITIMVFHVCLGLEALLG